MIKINYPTGRSNKDFENIPIGTYFTGSYGGYTGLFVASHGVMIWMENPKINWIGCNGTILDYKPVDIEITIK